MLISPIINEYKKYCDNTLLPSNSYQEVLFSLIMMHLRIL